MQTSLLFAVIIPLLAAASLYSAVPSILRSIETKNEAALVVIERPLSTLLVDKPEKVLEASHIKLKKGDIIKVYTKRGENNTFEQGKMIYITQDTPSVIDLVIDKTDVTVKSSDN